MKHSGGGTYQSSDEDFLNSDISSEGGDSCGTLGVMSSNLGGGIPESFVETGAKIGGAPKPDLEGNLCNGPCVLFEKFMGPLETNVANEIIGR